MNVDGYLTNDQIKELLNAGWEIGGHSMNHSDLVKHPELLRNEVGKSKLVLEDVLNVNILTFAYTSGKDKEVIKNWVRQIGNIAGMGVGTTNIHNTASLYFLSRRQVISQTNIFAFSEILSYN